jgi:hypothetical protein
VTEVLTILGTAFLFLLCALLGSLWEFTLAWGPRLSERRLRSPAGAGRFVAGTVARMQNATALFVNVVEVEFCELRLD